MALCEWHLQSIFPGQEALLLMSRVAIVIPTWNRAALLANSLKNLERQTYPVEQVIVVDNASTDDSKDVAKRAGAHVISLSMNAGFAAAVNRGIRETGTAEFVGVLNNDVSLAPDWLAQLMAKLEETDASFATGKLLDAKAHDRIEGSFDAVCRGGCALRCGHGRRWLQYGTGQRIMAIVSALNGSGIPSPGFRDGGILG